MNIVQEVATDITIGQMVANNFRAAEVFRKYGIDFCCKGGRTLKEVCRDKNLDTDTLEQELYAKTLAGPAISEDNYQAMELDELADHIVNVHHSYVRESIPSMLTFLHKIHKVHGARHPELAEVFELFSECSRELTHHMVKEEGILFPAIRKMSQAVRNGLQVQPFFFGELANPITMMEKEHSTEGDRFFRIAEITGNFAPPADGCTTYQVAFKKLEEFQNDLFTHIHLENNLLFPKALAMEAQLRA
jgi:regulator of cell morphogenesis and NO signaling